MDSEDLPLRRPPRLFTEMETAKAITSSIVLWIRKTYRSTMHRKACTLFQDLCLRLSLPIWFLRAFVFVLLISPKEATRDEAGSVICKGGRLAELKAMQAQAETDLRKWGD